MVAAAGTPASAMSDRRLLLLAAALVVGIAAAWAVESLFGRQPPAINFLDDTGLDASGVV